MYEGNNPKALLSQKLITDALLEMMKTQSFAQISVKDLCDRAQVSRQTFYTLFKTKESVLARHFDGLFEDYAGGGEQVGATAENVSLTDICRSAFAYLAQHKDFLLLLVDNRLEYIIKERFALYLEEIAQVLHANVKGYEDYANTFLSGALVEMLSYALRKGELSDYSLLADLTERILSGNYFYL